MLKASLRHPHTVETSCQQKQHLSLAKSSVSASVYHSIFLTQPDQSRNARTVSVRPQLVRASSLDQAERTTEVICQEREPDSNDEVTQLCTSCKSLRLPRHIAIIMDGNARWAKQNSRPVFQGHEAGISALKRTIRWCRALKIPALTDFALSTENWNRSESEVRLILKMTERVLAAQLQSLVEEGIRVSFIGDIDQLPSSLKIALARAERETAHLNKLYLNVAINFGGRRDIAQAAHRLLSRQLGARSVEPLSIDEIEEHLLEMTGPQNLPKDLKHPDLLIRTGGHHRLSNFLLWDLAYSELHFSKSMWPSFSVQDFWIALSDYSQRQRSFGKRV